MDWKTRAEREAAAIIAEACPNETFTHYDRLLSLVAIGWLQGSIFGNHEMLSSMSDTFEELRGEL